MHIAGAQFFSSSQVTGGVTVARGGSEKDSPVSRRGNVFEDAGTQSLLIKSPRPYQLSRGLTRTPAGARSLTWAATACQTPRPTSSRTRRSSPRASDVCGCSRPRRRSRTCGRPGGRVSRGAGGLAPGRRRPTGPDAAVRLTCAARERPCGAKASVLMWPKWPPIEPSSSSRTWSKKTDSKRPCGVAGQWRAG